MIRRTPLPRGKAPKRTKMKAVGKHQHKDWRAKRARILTRDRHWCRMCDLQPATQVHHLSYGRGRGVKALVNVEDDQLLSVCGPCHAEVHPWLKPGGGSPEPSPGFLD